MNRLQVYKCSVCGNTVEVFHVGGGTLTCCDKPMVAMEEKSADSAKEKHVPVIEKIDGGYTVKVGSVPHPMDEKHYIEWIELIAGDAILVQFLKPGEPAAATFKTDATGVSAREHCTVHGLWKS
jgi:superoxide reductase